MGRTLPLIFDRAPPSYINDCNIAGGQSTTVLSCVTCCSLHYYDLFSSHLTRTCMSENIQQISQPLEDLMLFADFRCL